MKILDIEKRDVYFVVEFSVNDLLNLKRMMDHGNFVYDSTKEPEMESADEYFNKKFYPMLVWVDQFSKNEGVVDGPPPNTE